MPQLGQISPFKPKRRCHTDRGPSCGSWEELWELLSQVKAKNAILIPLFYSSHAEHLIWLPELVEIFMVTKIHHNPKPLRHGSEWKELREMISPSEAECQIKFQDFLWPKLHRRRDKQITSVAQTNPKPDPFHQSLEGSNIRIVNI